MIVKVKFKDGSIVLFGDSYKKWQQQFAEFTYRKFGIRGDGWVYDQVNNAPVQAWVSKSKWKAWGGLKWCSEDEFQNELNREGCQSDEPDNPKPRKYSEMQFDPLDIKKLDKALLDYMGYRTKESND